MLLQVFQIIVVSSTSVTFSGKCRQNLKIKAKKDIRRRIVINRGVSRTLSNIYYETFCQNSWQVCKYTPGKALTYAAFRKSSKLLWIDIMSLTYWLNACFSYPSFSFSFSSSGTSYPLPISPGKLGSLWTNLCS